MGSIQHFDTKVSVNWNTTTTAAQAKLAAWDINNNGNADGVLAAGCYGSYAFGQIVVAGYVSAIAGSGQVSFELQTIFPAGFVAALSKGQSTWGYNTGGVGQFAARIAGIGCVGSFLSTTAYAGFAFTEPSLSGPFYGWAKVRVDIPDLTSVKITLFEWAFEDTGGTLKVGDTGAADVPAPAAALLALLGLGALGVQAYRRRRAEGLRRLAEEQDQAAA